MRPCNCGMDFVAHISIESCKPAWHLICTTQHLSDHFQQISTLTLKGRYN
jgi:hypothetical protein